MRNRAQIKADFYFVKGHFNREKEICQMNGLTSQNEFYNYLDLLINALEQENIHIMNKNLKSQGAHSNKCSVTTQQIDYCLNTYPDEQTLENKLVSIVLNAKIYTVKSTDVAEVVKVQKTQNSQNNNSISQSHFSQNNIIQQQYQQSQQQQLMSNNNYNSQNSSIPYINNFNQHNQYNNPSQQNNIQMLNQQQQGQKSFQNQYTDLMRQVEELIQENKNLQNKQINQQEQLARQNNEEKEQMQEVLQEISVVNNQIDSSKKQLSNLKKESNEQKEEIRQLNEKLEQFELIKNDLVQTQQQFSKQIQKMREETTILINNSLNENQYQQKK